MRLVVPPDKRSPEGPGEDRVARRARHGHVGADSGEWLEHFGLRVVETVGQRDHRCDHAHPDREPERREDGAAAATAQLSDHVAQVEHPTQPS
jgi:hypothetical protein